MFERYRTAEPRWSGSVASDEGPAPASSAHNVTVFDMGGGAQAAATQRRATASTSRGPFRFCIVARLSSGPPSCGADSADLRERRVRLFTLPRWTRIDLNVLSGSV